MFNCVAITPTTGQVCSGYAFSLFYMQNYFARVAVYDGVDKQGLRYDMISGSGVSAAREEMAARWLDTDITHILFIDQDMRWPREALHCLASRRLPLVGCNYAKRFPGAGFSACRRDRKGFVETTADSTGVEPVWFTGFGFCLIAREVFEAMPRPWFLIGYNTETDKYTTEDAGFARILREHTDYEWYVDHDASKGVRHVGSYDYQLQDALGAGT